MKRYVGVEGVAVDAGFESIDSIIEDLWEKNGDILDGCCYPESVKFDKWNKYLRPKVVIDEDIGKKYTVSFFEKGIVYGIERPMDYNGSSVKGSLFVGDDGNITFVVDEIGGKITNGERKEFNVEERKALMDKFGKKVDYPNLYFFTAPSKERNDELVKSEREEVAARVAKSMEILSSELEEKSKRAR